MSDKQLQLHIRAVILLILSMTAIAMLGEVSRQNWDSKVTAFPTKTEAAIDQYAAQLLREMTLEEKVGQMFFAMDTDDAGLAAELGLGGLLLSDVNVENLDANEVKTVIGSFRAGADIPPLIAANEEGGECNTLSCCSALRAVPFLSPRELMTTGGMQLVRSDAAEKCAFLRELGVHMNLAPVCDVTTDPEAYLADRAFGRDADATARYVETVVGIMEEERVISVLKHFPGYGNLPSAEAEDSRTAEQLKTVDFLPFARGIEAGADMVMMSHVVTPAVDGEAPASLSRKTHNLLRRSLDFDGVILTDDLGAEALSQYGDPAALAVMAVQAGNDLLLTADFSEQIPAVVLAVTEGEISRERIDESVLRILKLKIQYGIVA